MTGKGAGSGWGGRCCVAAVLVALLPGVTSAQLPNAPTGFEQVQRPPGAVGPAQNLLPPANPATPQAPLQLQPPPQAPAPPAAAPQPAAATPVQTIPMVPPGQIALMVQARFGRDPPPITGALHWRIYPDKPDATGAFRLVREEKAPSPIFVLPPGGYVVHVSFGLASASKRVQLRSETVREVFEIVAGGARFEGRVGDSRIPPGQISFDVFRGSQFEPGDKRPVTENVATGDVVLLPEGAYHVVSNYGDSNATVRSDIRVQAGRLTDVVINHRAAVITLKLVNERGGEALANTAWSVLTPGGDVVKEAVGAFPKVILAEGEYTAIARNEGRTYNGRFKVEPGFDREIEVMAR